MLMAALCRAAVAQELMRYLLEETDLEFEEIAERCGFASRSYLWDFCRRYFHDTPKNLRQQWKADKEGMIVPMILPNG